MAPLARTYRDPNALEPPEFYDALDVAKQVRTLTQLAKREDLDTPARDITSSLLDDPDATLTASLRVRQDCRVAGLIALGDMLAILAPDVSFSLAASDAQPAESGSVLATLRGPARELLLAERTVLNMLSRLSAIATITSRFVEKTGGTNARIFDTRKTVPAYRVLEKYAVRCGGGCSHRLGLYDAILIKDNHLQGRTGGTLTSWLNDVLPGARASSLASFVEVEVDTVDQLESVLSTQAGLVDIVLLDNFSPEQLLACVALRKDMGSDILLEASGGITIKNVAQFARTGIERIAVGAITHSAPSIDIGLDLEG
ncbi:MAG: carboxylating nicotinate-nucleotide diphosphorylase [Phycisphaerales bacterium JB043]